MNSTLPAKLNKFSPFLFLVVLVNLHNLPFISSILAFFYVLKNYKILFEKNIFYHEYLSKFLKVSLLLAAIGISLGVLFHNSIYDLLKDTWYFSKITFFFLFGYILFRKYTFASMLYSFFLAGILGIASFVLRFFYDFVTGSINYGNLSLYRWSIPEFPFELIILVIILTFFKEELNNFSQKKEVIGKLGIYFVILLVILITFSTFSRTYLICIAVIFLFYKFNYISFKKFAAIFLFVCIIIIVAAMFSNNPFVETLITKFESTKDELFSFGYSDKSDVYTYWRAYEIYVGLIKYISGSIVNYLFGFGFGALTDLQLNYAVPLGGGEFYEIPTFHNGFLFVLIKAGAIGLLSYLLFFFKAFSYAGKNLKGIKKDRLLLMSIYVLGIIFFLTSFAITGLFHLYKFNTALIIFSYLLFLSRTKKTDNLLK